MAPGDPRAGRRLTARIAAPVPARPRGWRPRWPRRPAAAGDAAQTWSSAPHMERPRSRASLSERSPCGSEENRHAGPYADRIARCVVDRAERGHRALSGLGEAGPGRVAVLDLAAHARVVLELSFPPLGVGQIQELDSEFDVPPAV